MGKCYVFVLHTHAQQAPAEHGQKSRIRARIRARLRVLCMDGVHTVESESADGSHIALQHLNSVRRMTLTQAKPCISKLLLLYRMTRTLAWHTITQMNKTTFRSI